MSEVEEDALNELKSFVKIPDDYVSVYCLAGLLKDKLRFKDRDFESIAHEIRARFSENDKIESVSVKTKAYGAKSLQDNFIAYRFKK